MTETTGRAWLDAVRSVACPHCGAGQQERCVSRTGRPAEEHAARYAQAEKAGAYAPAFVRNTAGERVSVNKAALGAFISDAGATWAQRDQEFCCSRDETVASAAEFDALVEALDIRAVPDTAAPSAPATPAPLAGEKETTDG